MIDTISEVLSKPVIGVSTPIAFSILPYLNVISVYLSFVAVLIGIAVGATSLYLNYKKIKKLK